LSENRLKSPASIGLLAVGCILEVMGLMSKEWITQPAGLYTYSFAAVQCMANTLTLLQHYNAWPVNIHETFCEVADLETILFALFLLTGLDMILYTTNTIRNIPLALTF
jgi:hypothetical protein